MKKVLTLAALLALTACGPKKAQTPPADSTTRCAGTGRLRRHEDGQHARDTAHSM